jgi:hypothetical protein
MLSVELPSFDTCLSVNVAELASLTVGFNACAEW